LTRVYEPSAEDLAAHNEWVESRPPEIRAIAERVDPWTLYRIKQTGQIVGLCSISEAEPPRYPKPTVTVSVMRQYNPGTLLPDFNVFGLDPDDLEAVEPPVPEDGPTAPE